MLEFILSETKAEEKTAHEGEEKAQADSLAAAPQPLGRCRRMRNVGAR